MTKLITSLILVFNISAFNVSAQIDTTKFDLKLMLEIKDGSTKGAIITITKDGAPFRTFHYKEVGFHANLDLNSKYVFTCAKEGYITKTIEADTHVPKGREAAGFNIFTAIVTLTEQPKNTFNEYLKPVGFISYIDKKHDFGYTKSNYELVKTPIKDKEKKQ